MQYIDRFFELGDVEHSVLFPCVNAYLEGSGIETGDRLPVTRHQPLLGSVELIAGSAASLLWKVP